MKLGYIPDAPDPRDRLLVDSPIAGAEPLLNADSIEWRGFDSPRVQRFNSCVGQSIAAAAFLCAAIAGQPITFPSALWPYAVSRLLDAPRSPMHDDGCRPRLAMMWCRDRGLVREDLWLETPMNVNAVPPLDAFSTGDCARLQAFYRIESGVGSGDLIRAALRRGYCPIFAITVDSKFEQLGRGVYDAPGGTVRGGHMMTIIGWSAALDAFLVRNTWGKSWGDSGYGWVSGAFLERAARDVYVISAAPEVR